MENDLQAIAARYRKEIPADDERTDKLMMVLMSNVDEMERLLSSFSASTVSAGVVLPAAVAFALGIAVRNMKMAVVYAADAEASVFEIPQ